MSVADMASKVENLMERYHSLFVWYISVRFTLVGLEYMIAPKDSLVYWGTTFPGLDPHAIGLWMLFSGAFGIISRIYCSQNWTKPARQFTTLFVVGVLLHSIYRMSVLVMSHQFADPIFMLFLTDLLAVSWLQFQLSKWPMCRPRRCQC